MFISKLTKSQNCFVTFLPTHCVFQDLTTEHSSERWRLGSRWWAPCSSASPDSRYHLLKEALIRCARRSPPVRHEALKRCAFFFFLLDSRRYPLKEALIMRARSKAPKRSVFFFSSLLVQRKRVAEAGLGVFFFF